MINMMRLEVKEEIKKRLFKLFNGTTLSLEEEKIIDEIADVITGGFTNFNEKSIFETEPDLVMAAEVKGRVCINLVNLLDKDNGEFIKKLSSKISNEKYIMHLGKILHGTFNKTKYKIKVSYDKHKHPILMIGTEMKMLYILPKEGTAEMIKQIYRDTDYMNYENPNKPFPLEFKYFNSRGIEKEVSIMITAKDRVGILSAVNTAMQYALSVNSIADREEMKELKWVEFNTYNVLHKKALRSCEDILVQTALSRGDADLADKILQLVDSINNNTQSNIDDAAERFKGIEALKELERREKRLRVDSISKKEKIKPSDEPVADPNTTDIKLDVTDILLEALSSNFTPLEAEKFLRLNVIKLIEDSIDNAGANFDMGEPSNRPVVEQIVNAAIDSYNNNCESLEAHISIPEQKDDKEDEDNEGFFQV